MDKWSFYELHGRANSFANGLTRTIFAIAFAMLAAFFLASCSDNSNQIISSTLGYQEVYDP